MGDFEFKGGSEYSQEVLADVQRCLVKALKALNDADHNFAFIPDCELDYQVVATCKKLLISVSDNLYVRKK